MDSGKGMINGWYWRFDAIVVAVVAILEVVAYVTTHGKYTFLANGELGTFVVGIMVVQKAKERRTANAITSVLVSYAINLIFQFTIGYSATLQNSWGFFAEQNGIMLVIGVFFAVLYSRTTSWSDKRRQQLEAKRAAERREKTVDEPDRSQQRVHRVKKKQGRGKRP